MAFSSGPGLTDVRGPTPLLLATLLAALSILGCGATKEARTVAPSGFLVNFPDLRQGTGEVPA
jgi:hypothetical protein